MNTSAVKTDGGNRLRSTWPFAVLVLLIALVYFAPNIYYATPYYRNETSSISSFESKYHISHMEDKTCSSLLNDCNSYRSAFHSSDKKIGSQYPVRFIKSGKAATGIIVIHEGGSRVLQYDNH